MFPPIKVLLIACMSIFFGCNDRGDPNARREAFEHLSRTIELKNSATRIIDSSPGPEEVSSVEMERVRDFWRKAYEESKKIDVAIFNREEPGFGDAIRDLLVEGLRLCADGADTELVRCQLMLGEFGERFDAVRAKKRGQ